MQKKVERTTASKATIYTLIGGTCWGFSGTCGQYLLSNCQVDARWLTAVRMLSAGVLLTCFCLFKKRATMVALLKDKTSVIRLLLFALAGLTVCQFTYLNAIKHTNAGTATVLQYLGPILILIFVCSTSLRLPKLREAIAIILALMGTFFIATGGDLHTLVITKEGLFWGIMSAVGAFLYTLLPRTIMAKWGSTVVTGLGMLVGGIVLFVVVRAWSIPVAMTLPVFLGLVAIIVVGTVIAFTLYLQGVMMLGAVKASMLASVEPVAATCFSAIFLGTTFGGMDLLGFACILTTVFLISDH